GEISAAINLIEIKKENLRKSFLHLQSQSSSSALNLNLNWTDFDSYFTTISSSLRHRFQLLNTLNPSSTTTSILKHLCRNSDGIGLRRYITNAANRSLLLEQLPDAYLCAPDAPAMVLDAMAGFYCGKSHESCLVKGGCTIMLEGLMRMKLDIRVEMKNKAMKVAMQWNRKRLISSGKAKRLDAFGFLLLVAVYGLMDGFSMDELIDCFVIFATRKLRKFDLCRKMIPANKIDDLIQELINRDMVVDAVKFSIEFQKTDRFSPGHLFEQRKVMSTKIMEVTRKNGKDYQNKVIVKEIEALRSMIKCIDEYGLESVYPKDIVVDLVKKLENEAGFGKRVAVHRKQQQQPQPKMRKLNNFLEVTASTIPTSGCSPAGCTPMAPYGNIGYGGPGGSRSYLPQAHPPSGSGYIDNSNELAAEYRPSYYPH
ncbi:Frigida-like protein, partial [Cynara cardunculus var. scolymus]